MKKVLLIDEEKSCRTLYTAELSRAGYKILGARSWKSAVRVAQKEHPDCVVVDIGILDVHGFGVIRSILAKTPSVPIILTSSCHDETDDFSSWCAPATMVKTSDLEALKQTLDRATRKREAALTA